jgi:hypothetical protein
MFMQCRVSNLILPSAVWAKPSPPFGATAG